MNSKTRYATLLLALLALGCKGGQGVAEHADEHGTQEESREEEGHSEDIVLTAEAMTIAGIETRPAERTSMQQQLRVPGMVTTLSRGRAVITSPAAGQVVDIHVRVGERVRAGQPIATLRSGDLAMASVQIIEAQQAVASAQAEVKRYDAEVGLAQAKLRTAHQVLTRQQSFARTGAFSQPALQAAQKELSDAQADLERGKQDQAVHEVQLERAERLYSQELISRTELEQARLEVATDKIRQRNAERAIELAKATYERERKIADQGLSNSREIQAAEAEVRAASLEVEKSRIELASAEAAVSTAKKGVAAAQAGYAALAGTGGGEGGTLVVKAPIDGVVVDLEATLGQAIERTTELAEIDDLSRVMVIAQVPDKRIGNVKVGATAQVTVSGFPRNTFGGVINSVGGRLDQRTQAMPVQILISNEEGKLRSGMAATVRLGVGSQSLAISVPRTAIVEDGDSRKLYVAEEGGKFEERVVVLGRIQGDIVEIIEGVAVGERVVIKGAFVLKSEKVKSELKGHGH